MMAMSMMAIKGTVMFEKYSENVASKLFIILL